MNAQSLAPHTGKLIEAVSRLECIKPFVLVGGTALSIQLKTRQSEDLDFMRWQQSKDGKLDIGWPSIQRELETIGKVEDIQVAGFDQVLFIVDGVKISFYAAPRKQISTMQPIQYKNHLRIADIETIGALKMEVMLRRAKFRDYYDLYSILKSGIDIYELISAALEHSNHMLKKKNLLAMITNGEFFAKDRAFDNLLPIYNVSPIDIQEFIKSKL